jgi:RHS repeat-associated protein
VLESGLVHSQTSNGDPPDNDIGGNDSPAGVSSGFNGMVNTACAYDPYTGNARRVIDDIIVPGTVGAYPLKWTRYYNSRDPDIGNSLGIGWRHSYMWSEDYYGGDIVHFPDGREVDFNEATGIAERLPQVGQLILSDGGQVIFEPVAYNLPSGQYVRYRVARIIDPYGLATTISYDTVGTDGNGNDIYRISRITEPGGRYLLLNYSATDGSQITGVQAFTADNNVTQSVTYAYADMAATGGVYPTLTVATYADGTAAQYTYQNDNSGKNGSPKIPLLQTCDDVRYSGPMHQIQYLFVAGDRIRGKIKSEIKPGSGEAVSTLTFPAKRAQNRLETRGDGPKRTFTYSASGRLLTYTDFKNNSSIATHLAYDGNGFVSAVTDAGNHQTTYTKEPITGRVTHLLEADQTSYVDFDYGDSNNPYYLWRRTDENRHTTNFYRDGNHRIYQINYPGNPIPYETFTYNGFGQVLTHQRRNGYYEHFVYDGAGRLRKAWNPTTTAAWPPSDAESHMEFDYYPNGHPWADRVSTTRDQRGYFNAYEYDRDSASQPCAGRGLITRISHLVDGTYISFAYDQFGNVIAAENELRKRTSFAYDDYGRLITATPPAPAGPMTLTYERSGNGDPYLHATRAVHLQTDGAGVTVEKTYDENFRTSSVIQQDGTASPPTATFEYWPIGLLRVMHDPRGYDWSYTYTERNQLLSATNPKSETTSWHYDPAGNVDYIDRTDGRRVSQSYDEMNRVQNISEPATDSHNKTTTFTYWPSGKTRTVQDDNGQITTFEYDGSDLRTRMVYPDQTSYQQWGYDEDKNLTARRIVGGNTQRFSYDPRNRMTDMWWDDENAIFEYSHFEYDAANKVIVANNQSADISRQYDDAGRLLSETEDLFGAVGAKTVTYASDGAGKRTALGIVGTDYQFAYHYDPLGRIDQLLNVQNAGTSPSTSLWYQYSYDSASNETQRFCTINGVAQKYDRDELGRIGDLTVQNIAAPKYPGTPQPGGGGVPLLTIVPTLIDALVNNALATVDETVPEIGTIISKEHYIYDSMSRVSDAQRSGTAVSGNDHFDYDYSGQLNYASYTGWYGSGTRSVSYDQDQLGNRNQVTDNGSAQGYSRNGSYLNQYVAAPAGSVSNDGNHEVTGYGGFNYGYLDGKLATINGGGNYYDARYDALGRCIRRYVNGRITYCTYDGPHPIYEWNADGTKAGWNLYGQGIDEILLRGDYVIVPGGQGYFFQQNRLGSVTHLTSFAGNPIEKYRYDAFGAPTTLDPILGYFNNRFKFTGREYLDAFGIYEYRNRAYHPGLGRFLSEDPMGFGAGDSNIFRYCGGDPVNRRDPFGLGPHGGGDKIYNSEGMDSGSGTFTYGGDSDDFMDRVMSEVFGSDSGSGSSDAAGEISGAGPGFGGTDSGSGSGPGGLFGPALGGNGLGILGGGGDVSSGPDSGGNNVATVSGFNLTRTYFSGTKGLISLNLSGAVTETIPLFSDGIQDATSDLINAFALLNTPRDAVLLATAVTRLGFDGIAEAGSFFNGAQYTEKVLSQMTRGAGEFHSFPESVTAFEHSGSVETITSVGGDSFQSLRIPGFYRSSNGNWYQGEFRFIKDNAGFINERRFVPYP